MQFFNLLLIVGIALAVLEVSVFAVAKLVLFIKKKKFAKSRRISTVSPQGNTRYTSH